ncbi:MAG TPA: hypothetical protein VJX10_14015 [Pseudonocardiaceae bacterium]|nr:hypothetical protein [Pseudonocardiaceae bacterium]
MERALRWMATRKHALPLDLINHALNDPRSDSADYLAPLVAPTESMPGGTTESRALAAWGLVIHGIDRVGSADDARQQNALFAAFRLRRLPEITTWRSTLEGRFRQLMVLTDVFGDPPPSTTTPMHQAWRRGVREKLAPMLQEQADALTADGSGWAALAEAARTAEPMAGRRLMATEATNGDHHPSPGAQPVFLELFVTNVIMKGRAVHRRITERLVTARADGVDGYLATSIAGWHRHADDIPIRPLWGCLVEDPAGRYRDSAITRLIFPRTLSRDEHHYFASEAVDENLGQDRLWVNVEVDHHGIAPGRLLYGCVPVSGLTIRIRFDGTEVPEACWWYAEQTERERRIRPPDGDPHLLPIVADTVEHTFTERCYPRGNYGISLLWRSTRSVGLSL